MSVTTEVYDADPSLVSAALSGPHNAWNEISIELEGARFHELHSLVGSPAFTADYENRCHEILDELETLARSAGYADADTFANLSSGKSEDEIESDPLLLHNRYLLLNPEQGRYLSLVLESESILSRAAATSQARTFVNFGMGDGGLHGPIHSRMMAAYEDGRNAVSPAATKAAP